MVTLQSPWSPVFHLACMAPSALLGYGSWSSGLPQWRHAGSCRSPQSSGSHCHTPACCRGCISINDNHLRSFLNVASAKLCIWTKEFDKDNHLTCMRACKNVWSNPLTHRLCQEKKFVNKELKSLTKKFQFCLVWQSDIPAKSWWLVNTKVFMVHFQQWCLPWSLLWMGGTIWHWWTLTLKFISNLFCYHLYDRYLHFLFFFCLLWFIFSVINTVSPNSTLTTCHSLNRPTNWLKI